MSFIANTVLFKMSLRSNIDLGLFPDQIFYYDACKMLIFQLSHCLHILFLIGGKLLYSAVFFSAVQLQSVIIRCVYVCVYIYTHIHISSTFISQSLTFHCESLTFSLFNLFLLSAWTYSYFFQWFLMHYCTQLFWCCNCPRYGQWEPF